MNQYKIVLNSPSLITTIKELLYSFYQTRQEQRPVAANPVKAKTQLQGQIQSPSEYDLKLRYVFSTEDALQIAGEELALLADLCEAHFSEMHAELQRDAIDIARTLAEEISQKVDEHAFNQLLNIEFDKLGRIMLDLKRLKLKTDNGSDWAAIMRPSVKAISAALQKYNRLYEIRRREKESEDAMKQPERLNITYNAIKRDLYLDADV